MLIYPIILSPFSVISSQIRPKLCIDCKFYTKDFFTFSEFGKCSLFPIEKNSYFFVNGKGNNSKEYDYHYCSTARKFDNMCGQEGKFYEKKITGIRNYEI